MPRGGNGDRAGLRDAVELYVVSALTENFNIAFQDVAPRCRETTQGKKLQERLVTLKHRKITGPVGVQIITFSSRRRTAVVSYSAAHGSFSASHQLWQHLGGAEGDWFIVLC